MTSDTDPIHVMIWINGQFIGFFFAKFSVKKLKNVLITVINITDIN